MAVSCKLYNSQTSQLKKILLILTAGLLFVLRAAAQDTIYQKRGDIIVGHITETNKRDIKYYTISDPDSIINILPKALIDSIIFEDGSRQTLNTHRNVPRALEPRRPKALSPEIVALNPLKISLGSYYLDDFERATNNNNLNRRMILSAYASIEKMFFANKFGVKVMPFVGINRMAYGTGVGITAYPRPNYNVVFHTGPRLLFYRANRSYNYYNSVDGYTKTEMFSANHIAFLYDAGFDVRINKNWDIEAALGIGRLLHKSQQPQTGQQNPYLVKDSYIFENVMTNARLGLCYKF